MNSSNSPIDSRESISFKHNQTSDHHCGSNEHCIERKSPSMKHVSGDFGYQFHESQTGLQYHPISTDVYVPCASASLTVNSGYTQARGGFIAVPDHSEDMWTCPNCGAENPSWQTFCPLC
ncbi:hypothetical protein AG0111_0g952 [Alternaria gaisen]|uniref:Uncharacterized protein n=1 Tax=Alternaria gaisen TaxID=167740 RepID=A0ACB6G3N2_9PLEO|nr:hypothetical protein AG0111_0g952 [Alternaria gaisen]